MQQSICRYSRPTKAWHLYELSMHSTGGCRKATTGHCTCASTHLQHCGSAGKERRKCRMGQLQVHLEIGWKDAPTLFPEVICACAMICHRVPFVAASLPYSGVPTP
mmetsp:Transcript_3503/g.9373  ORF Transcript_3503/g.9373 Transcript_3503/m.9373 type:complete len:106 (-) Transcript_3503:1416-1733(-)